MKLTVVFIIAFLIIQFSCARPVDAQRAAGVVYPAKTGPQAAAHRLSAGDELLIVVDADPEHPFTAQIRQDGGVYIPQIGEIRAAGMTVDDFRQTLRRRLATVYRHPGVQVGLKAIAPATVIVLGDVAKPGQYPLPLDGSVSQLLALAGGTAATADEQNAMLYRGNVERTVSLVPPASNEVVLRGGDVLYVRPAPKTTFSVAGAVATPGTQTLRTAQPTVWDALVAAGGPKPEAALNRVLLYEAGTSSGPRVLDLTGGPAATDSSTQLKAGDVLTVREQRVLVLGAGNGSVGFVPVHGQESLIEVLVRANVQNKSQLRNVVVLRGPDVLAGNPKPEVFNVSELVTRGDVKTIGKVSDGDVVMVDSPRQGIGVGEVSSWLSIILSLLRF